MSFPFNQEDKTKDCGYRCMYYILSPKQSYETWLKENFSPFQPVKTGITFSDVCTVLDYFGMDFTFTQLTDKGLYLIYSGIWLKSEVEEAQRKNHGHYFIYHDGVVYCSVHDAPYRIALTEVVRRLEAKNIDGAFRCLRINGKQ